MSVEVMGSVLANPCATSTQQLVLLVLADHADLDGLCWPSIERLCTRCVLTERAVQKAIRELVTDDRLMVETGGGRGRSNRYRVNLKPRLQNPVSQTPYVVPANPARDEVETPHQVRETPHQVPPNRQEPSTEPSGEPSPVTRSKVPSSNSNGVHHAAWLEYRMGQGMSPEESFAKAANAALAAGISMPEILAWHRQNPGRLAWEANRALIAPPKAGGAAKLKKFSDMTKAEQLEALR